MRKLAVLFLPEEIQKMREGRFKRWVDDFLEIFPHFNDLKDVMINSFESYKAACETICSMDLGFDESIKAIGMSNVEGVWGVLLRYYLSIQVSSTEAERMFSCLKATLPSNQFRSHSDWISLSLMEQSLQRTVERRRELGYELEGSVA